MAMFKIIYLTLLAIPSASALAEEPSLSIGSQSYIYASSAEQQNASLHEFVKPGENLKNWTSLLTVQCHPGASNFRDVLGPYLKSREPLLLAQPQLKKSPKDGDNGAIFIAALGQKNAKTFEFVISRFVQSSDYGVRAIVLTSKYAVAKEVRIDQKGTQAAIEAFDLNSLDDICSKPKSD